MLSARSVLGVVVAVSACGGGGGSHHGGGDDVDASDDGASSDASDSGGDTGPDHIQNVFVIYMSEHSWSEIKDSASAPYINQTLLPAGAHASMYKTPPDNHPAGPNGIWLEAGDNLGVTDDNPPADNHQSTTDHLVTHLTAAGISWKAYVEGISGDDCPLDDTGLYFVRHNPFVYFDDVTDTNSATSATCKAHVRPYSELATDLAAGTVARYNFIVPDICHAMLGQPFGTTCNMFFNDLIAMGDTWLSTAVPPILASSTYKGGGALFVVWDEGTATTGASSDGPLPFFVLSPLARVSYEGTVAYTHSSFVRTMQAIFGITPLIRDAVNATDLSDLFVSFP